MLLLGMWRGFTLLLLLFLAFPLFPQEVGDPFSLVGLRLQELFERFGAPTMVSTARGNEIWQDDVIFRYNEKDLYIYRDRVWQVRVQSVQGISVGDPRQAAVLVLGDNAQDMGDHLLMPIANRNWPLMLRVNISGAGRVASIFIYRADF